jgi:thiol:disulfide interchange protein DsbC
VKYISVLVFLVVFARSSPALAGPQSDCKSNCTACHTFTVAEANKIFKDVGDVKAVKASPVKGLWELTIERDGRQAIIYTDFGKKLLIPGPIFDIATKRPITPPPVEIPKKISRAELEKIPLANSIILGKPNGKKRMFVFTDPDCPYCSRLHGELKKLIAMEPELAIYIKMFPLKMHPNAYDKARVILGSKSPEMLDKAYAGEKLPSPGVNDAKAAVDETISMGEKLGIEGTPAMIMPDGRLISGAMNAERIELLIENK